MPTFPMNISSWREQNFLNSSAGGAWLRSLILISFFGGVQSQPGDVPIKGSPGGGGIYRVQCLSCHARDCKGKAVRTGRFALGGTSSAPDLTAGIWKYGSELTDIQKIVTVGKGRMPAFGKKLTEKDIRDVAEYFRYLCGVKSGKDP